MTDDDDGELTLSANTLAALKEFRSGQQAEQERFAVLATKAQERFNSDVEQSSILEIDEFKEDWQLSQFWYTDDTASQLARELLAEDGISRRIAVLCAPSVYPQLIRQGARDSWLFEYDTRFEVLAGNKFVKYDYNHPAQLPANLKGSFDRIIVDPPFLSDECEVKAAMSVKLLAREGCRVILCTGAKMRELCLKLYKAKEAVFQVEHKNGRLSNDFMCLLNYDSRDDSFKAKP